MPRPTQREVDALYFCIPVSLLFFTLLISIVLIFFVIKYRRRSLLCESKAHRRFTQTGDAVVGGPIHNRDEHVCLGRANLFTIRTALRKMPMRSTLVAKQWMWKIQHSTGQREINELHVPVGRKIKTEHS